MTNKTTPRPWSLYKGKFVHNAIDGNDGFVFKLTDADKRLAIRAVNNYDELVKTLKDCEKGFKIVIDSLDPDGDYATWGEWLSKIRNVLDKTK